MKLKIIILIFLFGIAIWPFFKPGFFQTHDGEWMVIRFSAFHQTLAAGQFPVRFLDRLNNNYGYPVTNFLYPLPFYAAEIPKILGFNYTQSIKIVFGLATVLSGVLMFWALKKRFDDSASFAGSVLYVFAPYRFLDLYVRGSLGEIFAFATVPLILGSIFQINSGKKYFLPILSLSISILILSHNVLAVIFVPFFAIFSFLIIKKEKLNLAIAFFFAFLASAFFWLPAIYDLQFVKLSQTKISNISDHLVSISQIISPKWGYGAAPFGENPLSTQVGVVSLLVFLITCYTYFTKKNKDKETIMLIGVFTVVIFMLTKYSAFLWKFVPGIDVIQFPWRLLSLSTFISAYLLTSFIASAQKKTYLAVLFSVLAILTTVSYVKPLNFVNHDDSYYSTNEDTTTVQDEYLPLWAKEKPKERANTKIETYSNVRVDDKEIKPSNYRAKITAEEDTNITVNTIYFPGWEVISNNQKIAVNHDNKFGLITFKLPRGTSDVIIRYGKTPMHLVSEVISICAILFLGVFSFDSWRRQKTPRKT